jgi:hypothetical protein
MIEEMAWMGKLHEDYKRKGKIMKKRLSIVLVTLSMIAAITIWFVAPVLSQDKPADNMQILREKVKADKKLLVAANMDLTESEAKGFWPVYEWYQEKLTAINQRIGKLIDSYAADYGANALTNGKAKELTDELVAIGKAETELQAESVPKLSKVLPAKKVLRYLQIENKIRAAVKYELAANIPLVE